MIMEALVLCDAWILVEVGIGKFLIDLDVTIIFYRRITRCWSVLLCGCLAVSYNSNNRLNVVMD